MVYLKMPSIAVDDGTFIEFEKHSYEIYFSGTCVKLMIKPWYFEKDLPKIIIFDYTTMRCTLEFDDKNFKIFTFKGVI